MVDNPNHKAYKVTSNNPKGGKRMQPTRHSKIKHENGSYYIRDRERGSRIPDGYKLKTPWLPNNQNQDAAEKEYLEVKARFANPAYEGKDVLVLDLWKKYLEYEQKRVDINKLTPKSFHEKKAIMDNYIVPFFGEMKPDQISSSKWLDFCKHFSGIKAFDNQRKVLVNFLKWCQNPENGGYITYIPVFELPEYQGREGIVLTPEQIQTVYDKIMIIDMPNEARQDLRDLWKLLELTGCRRMEIQGLTWDKVDFRNKTISIGNPLSRTKRAKTIPVATAAIEILKERKLNSNYIHVFADRNNPSTCYNTSYFKNYLKLAAAAAGIPGLQFKDLRTTFAVRIDAALKDPSLASAYMGHSVDVHNTSYNRQQDQAKQAVVNAVENLAPQSTRVKLTVVRG